MARSVDSIGKSGGLRARLGPLLAVVWLLSLFMAFALVQMPVTQAVAAAIGRVAVDVTAVALMAALGGAVGVLIIGHTGTVTLATRAALQALMGLGALSLAVLVVGMAGLFPPRWLAWVLTIGLLAALHRPLFDWWKGFVAGLHQLADPPDDGLTRWLRCSVLLLLVLTIVMALLPPTKWDALVYHLTVPQHYLDAGRILPLADNHFSGFPQLVEMLYLWLMLLARPHTAALLHAVFGSLVLMLTLSLARRVGNLRVGWLAVIVLLVSDTFWAEFHWPYVDLALTAYTLAALAAVLVWHDEGEAGRRWLIYAGLFTGAMMGVKYTAAGYTVGVGVLVLWLARRGEWRGALRAGVMVTLVAVAAFLPWMIKNTLIDHNPLAPFLWGTSGFDALDQWYYLRPGTGLSLLQLLAVPLQATVFGHEGNAYQATTGVLLTGLLPFAAIGWRQRDKTSRSFLMHLLIFALPGLIVWFAGAATSWFLMQTRLLYPIFPALAIVGAAGLDAVRQRVELATLARLAEIVVLLALALAVVGSGLQVVRAAPLRMVLGLESEEDYLLGELGAHYAAMQAVNQLPEDAHVLFLWEPRTYYCERACEPDSMINNWWHARETLGEPRAIARAWQERGYSHVLIYETGGRFLIEDEPYDPMTEADWQALETLRGSALTLVWGELDAYTLYALSPEGAGS